MLAMAILACSVNISYILLVLFLNFGKHFFHRIGDILSITSIILHLDMWNLFLFHVPPLPLQFSLKVLESSLT